MSQMCRLCISGATGQNVSPNNFRSPSTYLVEREWDDHSIVNCRLPIVQIGNHLGKGLVIADCTFF